MFSSLVKSSSISLYFFRFQTLKVWHGGWSLREYAQDHCPFERLNCDQILTFWLKSRDVFQYLSIPGDDVFYFSYTPQSSFQQNTPSFHTQDQKFKHIINSEVLNVFYFTENKAFSLPVFHHDCVELVVRENGLLTSTR